MSLESRLQDANGVLQALQPLIDQVSRLRLQLCALRKALLVFDWLGAPLHPNDMLGFQVTRPSTWEALSGRFVRDRELKHARVRMGGLTKERQRPRKAVLHTGQNPITSSGRPST